MRARHGAGTGFLLVGFLAAGLLSGCGEPGEEVPVLETLEPGILTVGQSADPSLAVDPESGDILLAFAAKSEGVWNLWFTRSGDGGDTFSDPVRVNDIDGDVHPHAEGAPRLVAAPGVAGVFWNNDLEVEGRAFGGSDLRFARTQDGGATWSAAVTIQDDTVGVLPRANTFHGAAWAGDSTFVVAWLDGRDRDARRIKRGVEAGLTEAEAAQDPEAWADDEDIFDSDASIYAAFSHDLGATWEPSNRRIQENLCPCCRVNLARAPDGEVYGAWRQHFEGDIRDPAFRAIGYGEAEGDSRRIHADDWEYPGCPHSGPALDVDASGTIHAAWYTGAPERMGVHYARREAGRESFDAPTPIATGDAIPIAHPDVIALDDGSAVIARNVDAEGRRVVGLTGVSPDGSVTFALEIPGSEGGTHPQLARSQSGHLLVAWTESREGLQQIRMARLHAGDAATGRTQ